ncbi:MAG: hypothetical protein AB8B55_09430 [Mariniblastus sp.]
MNEPTPTVLNFLFTSVGPTYAIILPLAGVLCLLLTVALVSRGCGAMAAASILLVVNVPLLISVFAATQARTGIRNA